MPTMPWPFVYVMLSRPTKLDDLWIVDLPPRGVFETFLHEHNPVLVKRTREFEGQARVDERTAIEYVHRLSWQGIPWVRKRLSADEVAAVVTSEFFADDRAVRRQPFYSAVRTVCKRTEARHS